MIFNIEKEEIYGGYYREPTEEESQIVYQEELKGYKRNLVKLGVTSAIWFGAMIIPIVMHIPFTSSSLSLFIFVLILILLLTYIIHGIIFCENKLEVYKNREYMVISALYFGSEHYIDSDKRLCFRYGDGFKHHVILSSDHYFRHCSKCLFVKRYDNKKGYVIRENPDIVKIF